MSISTKILFEHIEEVKKKEEEIKSYRDLHPGEIIECLIDLVMVHEQLGGRISPEFRRLGLNKIWDEDRVFFILDHWVPPPTVKAAMMHQDANRFAEDYNFTWNMGQNKGICHQVLPEEGFARPGHLIVGSDSHTTTYGALNLFSTGIGATDVAMIFATGKLWFKVPEVIRVELKGQLSAKAMGKDLVLKMLGEFGTDGATYKVFEFGGEGLSSLSIDSRMTVSNMTVEMGAKAGIFEGDKRLEQWLREHPVPDKMKTKGSLWRELRFIKPDPDADYLKTVEYHLDELVPLVAEPYSPANVKPVSELGEIEIDEAFLGSCTNGRLEDLRIAARIVKGKKVPSHVKFIVIPASRKIYLQAMKEGLLEIFINAGGVVEYPSCGPCIGGHLGVLGPHEVCISSSNRNFRGRMGHPTSRSYLASPAVVAASALEGKIVEPTSEIWND